MTLKTRRPTGQVPPPVILLEGETGSGRSWTAAELSASPRVGRTYWIELGEESTADQYGAIPNVRYEIVEPDNREGVWDWHALYRAATDFRAETHRAADAGEPPPVLVVDHQGAVWDMLSQWADNRARRTESNAKALAANPNADYVVSANFWNDAAARWHKLLTVLLTTKGIVVLLSNGEEVTLFENDKPTRKKTWKVTGHKSFTRSMPIWVRLSRDGNPRLIKLRAVVNGVRPGVDREQALPGFTLERLVFERYGWDPSTSGERVMVPMVAGSDAPASEMANVLELAVESADTIPKLRAVYDRIEPALKAEEITAVEAKRLSGLVSARKEVVQAQAATAPPASAEASPTGPTEQQNRRMHTLWRETGIGGDREARLTQTAFVIGRDIESSNEMTPEEVDKLIAWLEAKANEKTAGAAA